MKSSVVDSVLGDGFLQEIVDSVKFSTSKVYALALKRLRVLGFSETDAEKILGGSNV